MSRCHVLLLATLAAFQLSISSFPQDSSEQVMPAVAAETSAAEIAVVATWLGAAHTDVSADRLDSLAEVIVTESRNAGFSTDLVLAVIAVESSGNPYSVSHAGALGLMQILPRTGEAEAARLGIPWEGPETLFDAETNVRLGVQYLRRMTDRFDDIEMGLVAYNRGPTAVSLRLRRGDALTAWYAERVFAVQLSTSQLF